ncbi:hypothetical protein B0H11DRAFT_1931144 [Mycena galericulata]|nr:hypothetical protein B0H11DRAFT_1931144 [Mycena galericulata]
MPEKGVLKLFEREIGWEERHVPSEVDRTDDEAFFDPNFTQLRAIPKPPQPKTFKKKRSKSHAKDTPANLDNQLDLSGEPEHPENTLGGPHVHAAPFVNSLSIKGRIHAKARGKELIVAICNSTTSKNPPIHRGEKSYTFLVPDELVDGPPVGGRKISIQAAFIRPKWTLVVVDHNASGLFHHSHLQPGGGIWPFLWSHTHGPVYSQEPKETLECLASWRQKTIVADDWTAIFEIMESEQTVFNGTGAQEATDQLAMALIHPQMAAVHVCSDDALWRRFHDTIIKYNKNRTDLALPGSPLPYVSGPRPSACSQQCPTL